MATGNGCYAGPLAASILLALACADRSAARPRVPAPRSVTFEVFPIALERVDGIVPLGNLNPPGHVFPTDHIYIALRPGQADQRDARAAVVAPASLELIEVMRFERVRQQVRDYKVRGRIDDHTEIYFGHLDRLADRIADLARVWEERPEYSTGGETYRTSQARIRVTMRAGEPIGWIGGPAGNQTLDFGLVDAHHLPPRVANPARWKRTPYLHAADPLARYPAGPLRRKILARLRGRHREAAAAGEPPVPGPVGGAPLQDLPGTARGCWFAPGVPATYPEDPHLALVRSNLDPDRQVFSIGTSMASLGSGVHGFAPRATGRHNRPFGAIPPDGKIYTFSPDDLDGLVLVSLPDPATLWIEYLPDVPSGTVAFTARRSVYRR